MQHRALQVINVYADYQVLPKKLYPRLIIRDETRLKYERELNLKLEKMGNGGEKLMLISVSSNKEHCFLGSDRYATILNHLYKIQRFKVAISSMPKDIQLAKELANKLIMPSAVVATEYLQEAILLLDRADIIFHGDGGLVHMAAALDKSQVVLFGRSNLAKWQPLSDKAVCLVNDTDVKNIKEDKIIEALKTVISAL